MPDSSSRFYVSSAVVVAKPTAVEDVTECLAGMDKLEIFAVQDSKIVLVIEGLTSGQLGATLSAISALPGVIAANMVFEHSEKMEDVVHES